MFGQLQVTNVKRLTRGQSLDQAVAKLLEFADYPKVLRWIQFPTALLVFLAHDDAPDSGAIYVYDRKRCVWLWVDFNDQNYGGYSSEDFDVLINLCHFFRLVESPKLLESPFQFLLEMARVLSGRNNRFTYWLVFFDGEEALKQRSSSDSLYGSRHLADRLSREGKLGQIRALILVDMIADRNLNILRESNLTACSSNAVFKNARELGYGRLFGGGTFPVEDDHLPFVAMGVPAVDIIDLTPFGSYHHTAQDSLDRCDPESLTIVGRVVLATLAELERRSFGSTLTP